MSTFRECVRAEIDAFKQGDRGSPLVDAVAMNVLVSSFVLAVATKDRARCRTLLARLVALGSLLADHPDLNEPSAPQAPGEPPRTLDTWAAELDALNTEITIETAGRAWVRHRHLFDGREGPSYEKAWRDLRTKLDAAKLNPNDVKAWLKDHDENRGEK